MPSLKIDATFRLIAHLPDENAGRFHLQILRKVGDKITPIAPQACAVLFPELAPHILLHDCDADGVPIGVMANAWYHCAGVFYPGEPYADHCGQTEAGHRLRRLLRLTPDRYLDLHESLQQNVDEFQSARALHALLEEYLLTQRPRWKREADAARVAFSIAMQDLGADSHIPLEAIA